MPAAVACERNAPTIKQRPSRHACCRPPRTTRPLPRSPSPLFEGERRPTGMRASLSLAGSISHRRGRHRDRPDAGETFPQLVVAQHPPLAHVALLIFLIHGFLLRLAQQHGQQALRRRATRCRNPRGRLGRPGPKRCVSCRRAGSTVTARTGPPRSAVCRSATRGPTARTARAITSASRSRCPFSRSRPCCRGACCECSAQVRTCPSWPSRRR
mmetsp:Transcript_71048/g.205731  ORF Transcript_71048/g.205731 Transcript_71048/m.205731 type:complete len:213 (-) Transcript_71048:1049-1687(-)